MPPLTTSRRQMLRALSTGFGYVAFAGLATAAAEVARGPLASKSPHHQPRAKRVIFLCMNGGPSHVDTFDHKPQLQKDSGKDAPATDQGDGQRKILGSPWKFAPRGQSGIEISTLFPHVAQHADDLCVLNGMQSDSSVHDQSYLQLHTGDSRFVRPSVGAWTLYGLGTENQDLPGFITVNPARNFGGTRNFASAFLPGYCQGTRIGWSGDRLTSAAVRDIENPRFTQSLQREQLDLIQAMNREKLARDSRHDELESVIASFELAFRMQSAVPEIMDFAGETEATLQMYGIGSPATDGFARQCLLARRFAEAGVRYIELCHRNWDQHSRLNSKMVKNCMATDQPIAALLADLKQRDLFNETLVIWGGEFGRSPFHKTDDGRDHNATGFSMWMAGGGVKGGLRYGGTDDYGAEAVEHKMNFHDLHATMLHLLGLDHEKLTYRYAGRDIRLTDLHGRVVKDIIA